MVHGGDLNPVVWRQHMGVMHDCASILDSIAEGISLFP